MITIPALALALALQVLTASPALAVSFAECEAWLCLPGGFPPWECNPAEAAVLRPPGGSQAPPCPPGQAAPRRLAGIQPTLGHNDYWHDECPNGGSPDAAGLAATVCSGTDSNGCAFSYSPQRKGKGDSRRRRLHQLHAK